MASDTSYITSAETRPQIQHIINIPEQIESVMVDQCYIYKVPHHLRKLNEEAYTPQFISIGPLYCDNARLKQEEHKQRYFMAFWKRLADNQALALKQYKAFLEENKERIGNCYSKPDVCQQDRFVDNILLDSVFIMELFLRKSNKSEQENDYMFTKSWICKFTQRDLLLLENQLPMFVLEELHKKIFRLGDSGSKGNHSRFIELAFNYFEDYYPHKSRQKEEMIKKCKSCKHFTDLIRYTYLPRKVQSKEVNPSKHFTPCPVEYVRKSATKLKKAGISFEKVQGESYLDIKFKKTKILNRLSCLCCLQFCKCLEARLQIPYLKIDQVSECIQRNLIALEQCHYSDQPFICNYVSLLSFLINSEEDVELFVDEEIIVNELGSHTELANLINSLYKKVVVTSNYYNKTTMELNKHYNCRCNCIRRSVYFRDPCDLSSVHFSFKILKQLILLELTTFLIVRQSVSIFINNTIKVSISLVQVVRN